jgi:hypothetical protein
VWIDPDDVVRNVAADLAIYYIVNGTPQSPEKRDDSAQMIDAAGLIDCRVRTQEKL